MCSTDTMDEIRELEMKIFQLTTKLHELRRTTASSPVPDYTFSTIEGESTLSALFGDRQKLLVIHNMGQSCRFCTLWADGINGVLHHLESEIAVILVSKDNPQVQREFASSRGWKFRMASHGGGAYIQEQTVMDGHDNMPGAVLYERDGEQIYRKHACVFGPGDQYCIVWNLLSLAGIGEDNWTPQYFYWRRPEQLEDRDLDAVA